MQLGPTVVLLGAVLALSPTASVSQDPGGEPRPPDGGTREVLVSILIPSLPNAPFAAIVNTESIRQLADGTTITLKNHRAVARDKAGRIFQERRLLVPDDGRHESVVTQIEISDPVGHEQYICKPRERVCQLELFSAPEFVPPDARPVNSGSLIREDLGKQLISGLETAGIRESAVIAAGAIGNDTPIRSIREFWYSPQLGVNLLSKRQDPRFGTQNFEVSEVSLGDPDPQLFSVPAGSKVIDLRKTGQVTPARDPTLQ